MFLPTYYSRDMAHAKRRYIQNRIRKYRLEAGYTQRDVARLLKQPNASRVCLWENGICLPTTEHLIDLSIHLGISMDLLIADHKEKRAAEILQRERMPSLQQASP